MQLPKASCSTRWPAWRPWKLSMYASTYLQMQRHAFAATTFILTFHYGFLRRNPEWNVRINVVAAIASCSTRCPAAKPWKLSMHASTYLSGKTFSKCSCESECDGVICQRPAAAHAAQQPNPGTSPERPADSCSGKVICDTIVTGLCRYLVVICPARRLLGPP